MITFTSDLGQFDVIYEAIALWASVAKDPAVADAPTEGAPDLLKDKGVVELGTQGSMFAVFHRDKVRCALFEARALSSREDNAREVHFGTLSAQLHKAHAENEFVRIGVISVRHRLTDAQIEGLSQLIILHRVHVLTGFFGCSHSCRTYKDRFGYESPSSPREVMHAWHVSPLRDLAVKSGAIGTRPSCQQVEMPASELGWTAPNFFMFFRYYTKIKKPAELPKWSDAPFICVWART